MRLTSILSRNARQPQNEKKVPFKEILPLKLRSSVSGKNQRTEEKGCLLEMSLLLTCLKENEFEDNRCIPELTALNQCYQVYTSNIERMHSLKNQIIPVPNSKNLTYKQITHLLRKYPTV
ncbi:PREDICTED: coiled-coil-helix-coiled-coil-helix domain-containing protein 1 [Trachymyrmex cornetzi]|uniref:Coiled-coil-helix-coiled-coil-helix domain-containing protein 1 n=1 Tax=Trachymyrmex cornetzi TaxID=471704 RepID=A0A151IWG7_9HYME|nr:PREDICTED: coiled-coil-helix-coiled-coil-helix domain-containing protein 1 [Trachymyrmex cornetzi]XP_018373193.1 PREDICTED: coiled-coil-helix-coiled-coil-helix domain-containing protein 1 [Trachymyrmex cornetzi]KYN12047.1 Coiled-coil-helix-coiled-coil-helix domain-containing protein 1 [Trachymyrmex cornetzi]